MSGDTEPIKVTCDCGKSFKVKPQAAGRIIKCPACKEPNRVVAPEPIPENPDPSELAGESSLDPFENLDIPQPVAESMRGGLEREYSSPREIDANPLGNSPSDSGASPYQAAKTQSVSRPAHRRYRALEILAGLYRAMAICVVLIWAFGSAVFWFGFFGAASMGSELESSGASIVVLSLFPWLAYTLTAAFMATALWAVAEFIGLAIDIQTNTFDAAYG